MNLNTRHLLRLGFAGAISIGAILGTLAPASAHVTSKPKCYGHTCRGKDPNAMGCDKDAYTLTATHSREIKVELRYSARCDARWARTTTLHPHHNYISAWLGTGKTTMRTGIGSVIWSDMWSGPVKACGSSFNKYGPCTYAE